MLPLLLRLRHASAALAGGHALDYAVGTGPNAFTVHHLPTRCIQ